MIFPPEGSARFSRPKGRSGFSLVELLIVVAIISILGVLAARSLNQTSASLSAAGEVVTGLASWARQIAVSNNNPTALVVLTRDSSAQKGAYRELTILEYEGGKWRQANNWKRLPEGIIIDPDLNASTFLGSASFPAGLMGSGLDLVRNGASVPMSDIACHLFLPRGGLLDPSQSPALRLVRGHMLNESQAQYRQGSTSADQRHYYDVILLGVSGLVKVVKP